MAARRLVVILLLVGLVGTMIAGALSLGGQRPETVNGFARQPVHWYLLDIEGETISLAYALTGVSSDCEREATGVVDEDDVGDLIGLGPNSEGVPCLVCWDDTEERKAVLRPLESLCVFRGWFVVGHRRELNPVLTFRNLFRHFECQLVPLGFSGAAVSLDLPP
jgi:hypothetical protein